MIPNELLIIRFIKYKNLKILLFLSILMLIIQESIGSLLIGALFQNEKNSSVETDEEIVFKHAVYISNQYKLAFLNAPPDYPTLLHHIIHFSESDQFKMIKKVCIETNGNLLAMIGPTDHNTLKMYVKSLCEKLDILHFDIEPTFEQQQNSFNFFPSLEILCHAFSDLIKKFGWSHAAVIYNSKTNLEKIRCLLGSPIQAVAKLDLTLKIANHKHEYRKILREIFKDKLVNIILDLEPEQTEFMMKIALQMGMINSSYHYIFTTLDMDTMNLEDFKYNRANITAFRIVKVGSPFYETISRNLSDYYISNGKDKNKVLSSTRNALIFDSLFSLATVIKEAEKTVNFNDANVSCIKEKSLAYGRLMKGFLQDIAVNGLTGLITFRNNQRKEFELDALQLKESGVIKCGDWSPLNGLNFTFYDEVYQTLDKTGIIDPRKEAKRLITLVPRVEQTLILKVTTKTEEPYVIEEDGQFKGFCIDILDAIAEKMNFKYTIYKVEDDSLGAVDENGTWNGMIRELIDKKADLALSSFTINYKREQVVDFTKPFLSLGISILYRMPTSQKPGLFSFLNPLSLEIWIYTLITYILVSLIMMVLARFSPYEWRNTHPCNANNDFVENQFTAWNSLWFAVGTLMQQGSDINPKALSTRLVGGVWWFFTLIIISSYTANLAAFLTVEKVNIAISNVEELANQTKIAYGCFKGGSTMNFFKDSRIPTYRRMWDYMKNNPELSFVSSNHEGIERVLSKDYAYLMESPLIDYAIQKDCNLTQVGGLLDSKGYGIATQKGSPYTDDISLKILEMQEKGEIQKFYNRWWKSGNTCIRDEKKDSKASSLNVENVGGIFVVLVGGVIIAMFISIIEFIYYAKKNASQINKPLVKQITDELSFAIKCGGSAKKIHLPTLSSMAAAAVAAKVDTNYDKNNQILTKNIEMLGEEVISTVSSETDSDEEDDDENNYDEENINLNKDALNNDFIMSTSKATDQKQQSKMNSKKSGNLKAKNQVYKDYQDLASSSTPPSLTNDESNIDKDQIVLQKQSNLSQNDKKQQNYFKTPPSSLNTIPSNTFNLKDQTKTKPSKTKNNPGLLLVDKEYQKQEYEEKFIFPHEYSKMSKRKNHHRHKHKHNNQYHDDNIIYQQQHEIPEKSSHKTSKSKHKRGLLKQRSNNDLEKISMTETSFTGGEMKLSVGDHIEMIKIQQLNNPIMRQQQQQQAQIITQNENIPKSQSQINSHQNKSIYIHSSNKMPSLNNSSQKINNLKLEADDNSTSLISSDDSKLFVYQRKSPNNNNNSNKNEFDQKQHSRLSDMPRNNRHIL